MNTAMPAFPLYATGRVSPEDGETPVEVDRIDDEQGTVITLHRNFDGDGPEDEYFFVAFTLENAAKLGEILRSLTSAQP